MPRITDGKPARKSQEGGKYWNTHTLFLGQFGPIHCSWDKLVQPLWETVWSFLKKLKREMPYDPVIPVLGIYSKKMKMKLVQNDPCITIFIAVLQ